MKFYITACYHSKHPRNTPTRFGRSWDLEDLGGAAVRALAVPVEREDSNLVHLVWVELQQVDHCALLWADLCHHLPRRVV